MKPTPMPSLEGQGRDIGAIGRTIGAHVAENWQIVLENGHDRLMDAYARAGDSAYGTYLDMLFRPVHKQLKLAGLRAKPRLPGNFEISREWGNSDETDQQRWMWSRLDGAEGPLGTIVTITYHDHTRFHVPRAPKVMTLPETENEAVVKALSRRSADFMAAREAKIEIAEYLASLEAQG